MSDNLRSKMIRLAATMPKGSSERKALLDVLAARTLTPESTALLKAVRQWARKNGWEESVLNPREVAKKEYLQVSKMQPRRSSPEDFQAEVQGAVRDLERLVSNTMSNAQRAEVKLHDFMSSSPPTF
jgi:hypothetical protein